MHLITAKIREELEGGADEKTKKSAQRFFKEEIICYGVNTGTVRKIAERHWSEVKLFSKEKISAFCEELFRSDYMEEAFVASELG